MTEYGDKFDGIATRVKAHRLEKRRETLLMWERHAIPSSDEDGNPRSGGDSSPADTYRDSRYMILDDDGKVVVPETRWAYPVVMPPTDTFFYMGGKESERRHDVLHGVVGEMDGGGRPVLTRYEVCVDDAGCPAPMPSSYGEVSDKPLNKTAAVNPYVKYGWSVPAARPRGLPPQPPIPQFRNDEGIKKARRAELAAKAREKEKKEKEVQQKAEQEKKAKAEEKEKEREKKEKSREREKKQKEAEAERKVKETEEKQKEQAEKERRKKETEVKSKAEKEKKDKAEKKEKETESKDKEKKAKAEKEKKEKEERESKQKEKDAKERAAKEKRQKEEALIEQVAVSAVTQYVQEMEASGADADGVFSVTATPADSGLATSDDSDMGFPPASGGAGAAAASSGADEAQASGGDSKLEQGGVVFRGAAPRAEGDAEAEVDSDVGREDEIVSLLEVGSTGSVVDSGLGAAEAGSFRGGEGRARHRMDGIRGNGGGPAIEPEVESIS